MQLSVSQALFAQTIPLSPPPLGDSGQNVGSVVIGQKVDVRIISDDYVSPVHSLFVLRTDG